MTQEEDSSPDEWLSTLRERLWTLAALPSLLAAGAFFLSRVLNDLLSPNFEPVFIAGVSFAAWYCGTPSAVVCLALSSVLMAAFLLPSSGGFDWQDITMAAKLLFFVCTNAFIIGIIHRKSSREIELEDLEERYRATNELIPFGAWVSDAEGNMLHLSESFLNAFHTTMARCVGMGWTDLIVEAERGNLVNAWRACIASGDFWDREYHMTTRDGKVLTVLSRGAPITGQRERVWVGIHLDITERESWAEQRLRQAEDIARSHAEIDQFGYVAAHDLQEPLRMIASYLQLLEKRYKGQLDDEADAFINYAVEGANRLKLLLEDLQMLAYVGRFPERRQLWPLADAASEAIEVLKQKVVSTGARIQMDTLPLATFDKTELVRLFVQLFDNALKFRSADTPAQVQVTAERSGKFWKVGVHDAGIGIGEEYQLRIFDLFQRLNPRVEYPGTGIGLAICKKIIEMHGGRIWVTGNQNGGSSFYFTIPA